MLGERKEIICDFCNVSHKMCYCYKIFTPYIEYVDCYSFGNKNYIKLYQD
jgi:hypothetical protein